MFGEDLDFC